MKCILGSVKRRQQECHLVEVCVLQNKSQLCNLTCTAEILRTCWRDYYLLWPESASGSLRRSWKTLLGTGMSGILCVACCSRNPSPDKLKEADGWMEIHHHSELHNHLLGHSCTSIVFDWFVSCSDTRPPDQPV